MDLASAIKSRGESAGAPWGSTASPEGGTGAGVLGGGADGILVVGVGGGIEGELVGGIGGVEGGSGGVEGALGAAGGEEGISAGFVFAGVSPGDYFLIARGVVYNVPRTASRELAIDPGAPAVMIADVDIQ